MGDLYADMRAVSSLGVELKKEDEEVLEDRWTEFAEWMTSIQILGSWFLYEGAQNSIKGFVAVQRVILLGSDLLPKLGVHPSRRLLDGRDVRQRNTVALPVLGLDVTWPVTGFHKSVGRSVGRYSESGSDIAVTMPKPALIKTP